ncbi:cytoplasmic dynein 2 intermediate chain 1 [Spea bombifrons]|uniref:cytoplasmic dynein 2 intermediate chain 1 n=1 Tax=Spea bombifrons TaxID=233779 RepID=UPI00234995A6|nr:cytoplasmic dynein 2 intermediate chain 1 [Spea bombifrons]
MAMQHGRVKSKEDTWKTEELQKHLKVVDSERQHDGRKHRERRHHRAEDKDELIERRRKHGEKERKEEKGHQKYSERDRHYDRDREGGRDHHTEKEKPRDRERDRKADKEKYESDRQRVREKDKAREGKYSGEDLGKISRVSKDYREGELTEGKERKQRETRESHEKNHHTSEDRESRHRERREKERKVRESEDYEDRDSRHRKHREDLNDPDRERRRRERKQDEREKRHRSRREKESLESTAIHEPLENAHTLQKLKERSPREQALLDGDSAKGRTEKKHKTEQQNERRKSDRKGTDKEEASDAAYDDSTNYEEDFEDYEDDFEDESDHEEKEPVKIQESIPRLKNPEIEAIQKAMTLENETIASFNSTQKIKLNEQELHQKEPPSVPNKGGHRGVFIDFGSAKQKQVNSQIASKLKKRSTDILRLVDLDFSSTVSLLDLAPVKEYDMYIRNFGKTNTKQAYVQCNEDCVDRDIQTEEIDIMEKWTQHPGESAVVCGGSRNEAADGKDPVAQLNSQRLTSFLRSSCQVIAVLLEEERAERRSEFKLQSKEPCMSISDGCFQLNTDLPFLQGRVVRRLQFSEAQRHLLLSVHGSCNSNGPVNKFIICVWNIWEPTAPQKVLVCESEVKCCCFSPGKAALVFAGTADGSVMIWDLREDVSMHRTMKLGDASWTFRSATFSTDGVYTNVNHSSPVKAMDPVLSAVTKEASLSSQEEVSGLSFQIASLDESGHLILWVVVELRKDDMAGSQNDLGLIPGGKVKLVYSSSIFLDGSFFPKDVLSLGPPQTLNVKFLPQDSNHFFVGTDIGIVTHGTRYGLMEPPRHYKPLHGRIRPSHVIAMDFSPFHVPAFLAGCSDGCIRLHTTYAEFPAMQWDQSTNGQAVAAVQWSLTRPSVFFVLDAAGCIYVWDLLQNDLQPVAKESVLSDQITSMAVFGEPEKTDSLMGLALAKASGRVEVQYIKKQWAKPQPKENDKLCLILY